MTVYERMIANDNFIRGIESLVALIERRQAHNLCAEPVCVKVAEDEIDFVWPMGFGHDRRNLESLRSRLDAIKKVEQQRARIELPPIPLIVG